MNLYLANTFTHLYISQKCFHNCNSKHPVRGLAFPAVMQEKENQGSPHIISIYFLSPSLCAAHLHPMKTIPAPRPCQIQAIVKPPCSLSGV